MRKSTKLGMMLLLLVLMTILLGTSVMAFSCDEYKSSGGRLNCTETNDPTPIITVNYFEAEPVTITSAVFFEGLEEERTVQITEEANINNLYFNYSVNQVLLDGYYEFALSAQDYDGNTQTTRMVVAVDVDDMDIWVSQPRITYISPRNQTIAIGQSLPFDIAIRTQFPAICRMKRYSAINTNLQTEFQSSYWHFNDGNQQETTLHRIQAVEYSASDSDRGHIGVDHPFDYTDLEAEDYAIICRQQVIGGDYTYSLERLYIGYDDTPFSFSAEFNPTTISDYSLPLSTGVITSTDELIACQYDFINNQQGQISYVNSAGTAIGPMHWSINSMEDHRSGYERNFSFAAQAGYFTPNQEYPYQVSFTCLNPAMWSQTETARFNVDLRATFTVSLDEADGFLSAKSPTFTARTTGLAICYYRLDGEGDWQQIGSDDMKRTHLFEERNLEAGYHEVEVRCESVASTRTETFGFTIDNQRPAKPVINASDYICAEQATIHILAPDPAELLTYNYTIANVSSFSAANIEVGPFLTEDYTEEGRTIRATVDLVPEKEYYWRVYAIDRAGNPSSSPATKKVTVKNSSAIYCDRILPRAILNVEKTIGGYSINITCQDAQTGCAATYDYSYIPPDETCAENPPATKHNYADGPQTFNNDGRFCYSVYDLAGNTVTGSRMLTPEIAIQLINPRFGIAEEKTFALEAATEKSVVCKHGYRGAQRAGTMADWYASLPYQFSNGSTQEHYTLIVASEIAQLDENANEAVADWVIICNEEGTYQYLNFTLGFDTTPPSIQVTANPNPIVDPGAVTTTLTVQSDDQVVCTYLDSDGIPTGFDNYIPADDATYKTRHSANISYWGKFDENIEQNIWCMNRAQAGVEQTYNIQISLDNAVGIQVQAPEYYKLSTVPINVTTNHAATCEYRKTPTATFRTFLGEGTTQHNTKVDVGVGEHTIEIHCTSRSTGLEGTVFHTVTVDRTAPTIEIITAEESCSLEGMSVSLLSNGTGSPIAGFSYNLSYNGSSVAADYQTSDELEIETTLTQGETYTLTVEAYDAAGNTKSASKRITATAYDALSCDTTPPKGTVKVSSDWSKVAVEVSCEDEAGGSGCTDSYGYEFKQIACTGVFSQQSYEEQPLHFSKNGTFCYQVLDQSNNKYYENKTIIFKNHCYNGIEDQGETGVDCGGPCPAACGTCENNIQDPFELGIDCGGVCESFAKCQVENNETKTQVEDDDCETDEDCDFYSRCVRGSCEAKAVEEDECSTNNDCGEDQECRNGQCQQRTETDDGINILGLIFIILGLLLIGGGVYYIYYTEQQKQAYHQRQHAYQEHLSAQEKAAQQRAAQKRLQALKERKQKGDETRQQKEQERAHKRKDLLGSFEEAVGEAEEPDQEATTIQETEQDQPDTTTKKVEQKEKKPKLLDEGRDEEYIDLTPENEDEESSVFKDLEKVAKGAQLETDKTSTESLEKDDAKEATSQEGEEITIPTGESTEETIAQEELTPEQKQQDSFAALEALVEEAHTQEQPHVEHLVKHTEKMDDVKTEDFVKAFTKNIEGKKLDKPTLISLLHVLLEEKKITLDTTKEILDKLASENFITHSDVEALFTELNS